MISNRLHVEGSCTFIVTNICILYYMWRKKSSNLIDYFIAAIRAFYIVMAYT